MMLAGRSGYGKPRGIVVHARWNLGLDVQSVDDSRNVAQYGQEDVDEKVGIAATFEEHA